VPICEIPEATGLVELHSVRGRKEQPTMVFIIKDLLVSVVRPDEGCKPHNTVCFVPQGQSPVSKATLLALKDSVERAIAEIDCGEKTPSEELIPHTLAEVEMLQINFDEAQIELNEWAEHLKNKRSF
jgi:hypothetical protein